MNAHRSDFVLWDDDQNDLIVTAVYGERVSQTVKVGQSFPQNSFIRALWMTKTAFSDEFKRFNGKGLL